MRRIASHTTSGAEYRRYPRLNVSLDVTRRTSTETYSERVTNLSRTGLALATKEMLPPGSPIVLRLQAPDGSGAVELAGHVRFLRSLDDEHMPWLAGVQFVAMNSETVERLAHLVGRLFAASRGHRESERVELAEPARLTFGSEERQVELVNLGADGALLTGEDLPRDGEACALLFHPDPEKPEVAVRGSVVRWEYNGLTETAALRFEAAERDRIVAAMRELFFSPRAVRAPSRKPSPGMRIGDFELGERIGVGGMCEVYRAVPRDPSKAGAEPVALKRLKPDAASLPGVVDRFLTEADLGRLLRHPCVVRVHHAVQFAGEHWMTMELVEGRSLQELILAAADAEMPLPAEAVLTAAADMLSALDYCHKFRTPSNRALEIVHGDVTPSNVLIKFDGSVKLTDFGAATTTIPELSDTIGVAAKLSYLPPELYRGARPSPQVDIYQAGVLLYEALTGMKPFLGRDPEAIVALAKKGAVKPSALRSHLPPTLDAPILQALSDTPDRRQRSAAELRDQILSAMELPSAQDAAWQRAQLVQVLGGVRREE